MRSKRRHEGYLLVDNRHAPVPDDLPRAGRAAGAGVKKRVYEAGTITCKHCGRTQVINALRTRDRPYCRGCDHYICDECALVATVSGGRCVTFDEITDVALTQAHRDPRRVEDAVLQLRRDVLGHA